MLIFTNLEIVGDVSISQSVWRELQSTVLASLILSKYVCYSVRDKVDLEIVCNIQTRPLEQQQTMQKLKQDRGILLTHFSGLFKFILF